MINNLNEILTVGMEIKNYKMMCFVLGEEERKGSPRKRQIENWERYFKYNKNKQKYIINEVYDMPLEKEKIILKGNHSIYIKYIETILLYLLSNQENQTLVCTKNYLLVALGITGRNYIDTKLRDKLVKDKVFKQYDINEFDNRAYQILDRILFSALNNLQRRCLLNWNQELHIKAIDQETLESIEWVANEEEIRNFTDVKYNIIKQLGIDEGNPDKYDSLRDIYFYNKTEKFYNLLKDQLYDKFGWDNTYIKYRLIYKTENVTDAISKTEKQLESIIKKNKSELNDKVLIALNNNATNHYDNLIAKIQSDYDYICELNNKNPKDFPYDYSVTERYIPNKNYVQIQHDIAEKLVHIKNKKVDPSKGANK